MAVKRKGWYSATRHCPPGHHWNGHQCVKTVPKGGGGSAGGGGTPPGDGGTTTPGPTVEPGGTTSSTTPEPFTGTVSTLPASSTGTTEAPAGGDLTGTSAIAAAAQDAVFSQGSGFVPQYRDDAAAMQQPAPQNTAQLEGGA